MQQLSTDLNSDLDTNDKLNKWLLKRLDVQEHLAAVQQNRDLDKGTKQVLLEALKTHVRLANKFEAAICKNPSLEQLEMLTANADFNARINPNLIAARIQDARLLQQALQGFYRRYQVEQDSSLEATYYIDSETGLNQYPKEGTENPVEKAIEALQAANAAIAAANAKNGTNYKTYPYPPPPSIADRVRALRDRAHAKILQAKASIATVGSRIATKAGKTLSRVTSRRVEDESGQFIVDWEGTGQPRPHSDAILDADKQRTATRFKFPELPALRNPFKRSKPVQDADDGLEEEEQVTNPSTTQEHANKGSGVYAAIKSSAGYAANKMGDAAKRGVTSGMYRMGANISKGGSHVFATVSSARNSFGMPSWFGHTTPATTSAPKPSADPVASLLNTFKSTHPKALATFTDEMAAIGKYLSNKDKNFAYKDNTLTYDYSNGQAESIVTEVKINETTAESAKIEMSGTANSWLAVVTSLLCSEHGKVMDFKFGAPNETDAINFIRGVLDTVQNFETCGIGFTFTDEATARVIHDKLKQPDLQDAHGTRYDDDQIKSMRAFLKDAFEKYNLPDFSGIPNRPAPSGPNGYSPS